MGRAVLVSPWIHQWRFFKIPNLGGLLCQLIRANYMLIANVLASVKTIHRYSYMRIGFKMYSPVCILVQLQA